MKQLRNGKVSQTVVVIALCKNKNCCTRNTVSKKTSHTTKMVTYSIHELQSQQSQIHINIVSGNPSATDSTWSRNGVNGLHLEEPLLRRNTFLHPALKQPLKISTKSPKLQELMAKLPTHFPLVGMVPNSNAIQQLSLQSPWKIPFMKLNLLSTLKEIQCSISYFISTI